MRSLKNGTVPVGRFKSLFLEATFLASTFYKEQPKDELGWWVQKHKGIKLEQYCFGSPNNLVIRSVILSSNVSPFEDEGARKDCVEGSMWIGVLLATY